MMILFSYILTGIDDSSYTEIEGLNSSEGDIYETNMFQGGQWFSLMHPPKAAKS